MTMKTSDIMSVEPVLSGSAGANPPNLHSGGSSWNHHKGTR